MVTRDPRWENVFASVGQRTYDIDTNTWTPPEHITRIRVDVDYNGVNHYYEMLVFKEDFESYPTFFKMCLDDIVTQIDQHMERSERGTVGDDS